MAISGLLEIKVNGEIHNVIGNWTYNLGSNKQEMQAGPDRVHGVKETPQVPFIEGEIRDRGDLNLRTLTTLKNATITASLANGKIVVFKDACYAADGDVGTEEANIQARFEAFRAEEVRSS